MRRILSADIRRERRSYKIMFEWTMQAERDAHMECMGDPVDVVNGIQPCPFVYLVKSTYNCYVDSLILLYRQVHMGLYNIVMCSHAKMKCL